MITSKDNKLIKYCSQVREKKFSKLEKVCLVETFKIVKEAIARNIVIKVFCIPSKAKLFGEMPISIEIISESIAKYLSDTVTSDGVFALCKIENKSKSSSRMLILDKIQDPTNVGAIIRSACAFGFDQIYAIDSAYPYTPKCIRCSMGQIFNVNFTACNYDDLKKLKTENNIKFVCADMNGIELDKLPNTADNLAVIIGNEGQGVSKCLMDIADIIVSIPMKNGVESLNASISASIIMYYLK